jgi:DNA repair exonuclease SbcCD nuclease subunit
LFRFKHIFSLNEQRRKPHIPIYYLSGNHDIGYSAFFSAHPEVLSRYEKEFGSRNYQFSAGKVDFVVIDAQTLDGARKSKERSSSWEFIKTLSPGNTSNPKVLLTHIPLYRPDNTPCGPHRSSPVINQRVSYAAFDQGITYQNYLTKETSDLLLSLLQPVLVLSGHDHDQCTVVHSTPFGPVTEVK